MTPFASAAILEKLALLKIALCRAPALSSAAFAFLRKVGSPAPLEDAGPGLVACFPLTTVLAPVSDAHFRTSDIPIHYRAPWNGKNRFKLSRKVQTSVEPRRALIIIPYAKQGEELGSGLDFGC